MCGRERQGVALRSSFNTTTTKRNPPTNPPHPAIGKNATELLTSSNEGKFFRITRRGYKDGGAFTYDVQVVQVSSGVFSLINYGNRVVEPDGRQRERLRDYVVKAAYNATITLDEL